MNATKILAACFGILLACLMLVSQAAYAGVAGYAQFVNGSVQIESLSGQMRILQKGGAINEGDTVISAQAGSAQIRMQDGGFIAVRPDTRLKIDNFKFDGKADGSERSFFSLFKGGFRAITGLIGRLHKSSYRITTASSTIGIRGTDHETFVVTPDSPLAKITPVGTYNKVNVGETSMTTDKGTIFVLPNQMGFAGAVDQMPQLRPLNTNIFTAVERPTKEAKVDTKETKEGAKTTEAKTETKEEVRAIATVDNTAEEVAAAAVAAPVVETVSSAGTGVDNTIVQPITTTNGTDLSGVAPSYAAQAQAAATAAATAASTTDFALLVSTAPAVTAIGSSTSAATLAVNNAAANVTTANALTPASTTTANANASAAQTLANTAAGTAAAAQTAFTSNGAFADSTAITANNLINNSTTGAAALVQNNNTLVQTAAATTLPAQNAALASAQTAAASALLTAQGNLAAANNALATANTNNGIIGNNQTAITASQSTISNNATAMAVLNAAGVGIVAAPTSLQLAVAAANTAASQAVALQAAGDLADAQAALATAQAAQAIVNAALTADASVTSATTLANGLTSTASTNPVNIVSTQLTAAQAAAASAAAALAVTDPTVTSSAANTLRSQANVVVTNAPIAAYNNPAVVSTNFISHLTMPVPATAGGYNIGDESNNTPQANTTFVLNGGGNLVEIRNTTFQIQPVQSTPTTSIASADVTWSGGTAADTFKLADNSIYMGRWVTPTVTVTDLSNSAVTTYNPADSLWAVMLAPSSGFVQSLTGTTTYSMAGATIPFDAAGNLGTLNSATLNADFTNQLVNASLNLTMPAASTMAGTYAVTANGMPISTVVSGNSPGSFGGNTTPVVSCSGTCAATGSGGYSADVGGSFAGTAAASAGLGYDIWPTVTTGSPVSNLVQGLVAFTAVPSAYNPNHIAVETAGGLNFNSGMMAAPADLVYVAGGTSTSGALQSMTFRDIGGGANYTSTATISGGTATSANAPAFAATGIQYGAWTGYTGESANWSQSLGGKNGGAPDSWMYGPEGYWDNLNTTVPTGTFTYQMDGATAPKSQNTGLTGTLSSATLTVDFANALLSGNMALTMPGNENWGASVTGVPIVAGGPFFATPVVTYGVGVPATTCATCTGNIDGMFTGQNFAGAILSYNLYNNAAMAGGDVSGNVALTRNYTGNTNPAVTNGTAAPTGNIVVATDYNGVSSYPAASTTTTGNLLTAFGSSGTGYSNSTTVTCTTCTTTASGDVTNSGIYYGTWDAGTYASSYSSTFAAGTTPSYWITGPEAGPLYLPQALTGTASYALDAGQVSNSAGIAGTVSGTTALALDFSKQTVGINLDVSIADTATTPGVHAWNVKTLPGNEAVLGSGQGIGGAAFYASTNSTTGSGSGLLTVSVDGSTTNVTSPNAYIDGQLTGTGLTGAIMSFNLSGMLTTQTFESINGVAAFTGTPQAVATSHQYMLMSIADPFSPVPLPVLGFYANAQSRITADASGNLTQFDIQTVNNNGGSSSTVANVSAVNADFGTDPVSGISWGRWAGGSFNVTDRATGTTTLATQAGSLHWITEPVETSAVTLPTSGTYTYTNSGGTLPTDNLGNVGTMNSATLSANFTAQTVDMGVNATVAGATLDAVGTSVPIIQNTVFYASSLEPATSTSHLTVGCTGSPCGATGGVVIGKFTGAGAIGAAMTYGLQNGATTISGVTAFHR